ncbi:hypothetical protein CesoFtcFv8_020114 [Champsocephalus esox]|uniref:FAD-binding FR-type domain-containing protein n=1 Tax=Champsocephalus esox TaxID=159716 RepID=A0AAN8BFS6_9TELE|nr:hypothetical protein CesoFtcFv8_020114 [Champsocephalus esox]
MALLRKTECKATHLLEEDASCSYNEDTYEYHLTSSYLEMRVPGFWSFAARSFSLQFPAAGTLCCRLLSPSQATRNMSSKRKMDHLERTAGNNRQNAMYPAEVRGIINESETVKRLRIAVPPDFSFKAGQWVDLFIPGVEKVGGFSMCSGPGLLQREGIVELAVKYAKHPPRPLDPHHVYSGLPDLLHRNQASGGRDLNIGSAHLCYSAKNTQELLFKNSIIAACLEFPDKLSCDLHVTQQITDVDSHLQPFINRGRITEEELRSHVDLQRTLCFLCGPPAHDRNTFQNPPRLRTPERQNPL